MTVDSALVPFGDSVSFEMRTRGGAGRLVFVQYLSEVSAALGSVELQLFDSQVQLTLRSEAAGQSVSVLGVSMHISNADIVI